MATKIQRKINRFVKKFNKSLAQDAFLGLNRFTINHICKDRLSGYDTMYKYEILDKKANKVEYVWVSNYDYENILFWRVNNFIIDIRKREGW